MNPGKPSGKPPGKSPAKTRKKSPAATGPDPEDVPRQSEAGYHDLFNTVRQAIYIQDNEGRFVDVNDGACAMYGYDRGEFIGRTPEFLSAPGLNDFEFVTEKIRLASDGEPQQFEFWARRKNGEVFPKEVHLCKGTYSGKEVLIAVATDITDRKRSERAFRESEELFREVFNNANDAVFLHEMTPDGPGKYLLVNTIALCWLGYTRDELMNMSPRDIVPDEVGQKIFQAMTKLLKKSGHATFESVHRRKNGTTYPVEVSTHIFVLGKRKVALSIARDITWRKQQQDELKESERRYCTLLSAVTDCVFSVRVEKGLAVETTYGPGCEAVTGYTSEELSSDHGLWLRMVFGDDCAAVTGQIEQIFKGHKAQPVEYRIIHKDGRVLWVRNTPVPRYDAAGNLVAYDGLIHDITAKKQIEQAFFKSEAQMNAIIRASPVPMFVIDNRHQVISWNKALENSTGILAQAVLGTDNHWRAFYPDKRPCLVDLLLDSAFEKIPELYADKWKKSEITEGAVEATDFFPHLGTAGKWLHFIAAPIIDNSGNRIGAVETLEDITGLVQAQQELKESESRYSALFTNNNSVSLLIDPDHGRIIDANDAAVRYYGYSRDQLLSMGIYTLNRLPEDTVVRNLRRAKNEKEKHFFSTHYRADGEKRNVEIYSGPIRVQGKPLFYSIIHDITDRKKAEEALQQSQYLLSEAMAMAHMADWEFDVPTGIFTFNDRFYALYGTTAEREGGYQMPAEVYAREFVYPDEADMVAAEVGRAITTTDPDYRTLLEHRIIRRDGEVRYIEVRIGITKDAEGRTIKTHGANQDITERRKTEDALDESQRQLARAMDLANVVNWEFDQQIGQFVFNDRFYAMYGTTAEREGGYRMRPERYNNEFVHPDDRDTVEESNRIRPLSPVPGNDFRMEHRIIRRDGEVRNIVVTAGAKIDKMGHVTGILGSTQDITDRKLAEQALRESEERYRTLIDQLPDYVIVHRDGILLYVNPAAATQLGYTVEMLIGKPLLPFIAPEYHTTVREAITLRMAGAEIPAYEMKIRAKDGTWRTVLANGARINFEGSPASLNVLSDITAIKLAEETIWRANEELEKRVLERTDALSRTNEQLTAEIAARNKAEEEISRSLEEKDLLLREIHHRVKNNLQIIASLLKLQSRTITDPNTLEAIKNSQSRIRAMALVHERIYRSHNISEINLRDYLDYLTKQIFQFYNIQQQIAITVTMDEILADIDTITPLGLIINELVSNSLKYAFPEGRKGAISIECTPQDAGMLRIVYHDNGTGMPAGFDWKNAESLGLRLVNSLVDQLNGTIESGSGEGTTFIITIQQKRESSAT